MDNQKIIKVAIDAIIEEVSEQMYESHKYFDREDFKASVPDSFQFIDLQTLTLKQVVMGMQHEALHFGYKYRVNWLSRGGLLNDRI